ncbi:MAG: hypothetical protein KDI66_22615, partial [Xanthomonadales bacterium]|nr:hypothetical protein [Xanthomonadales bacterium]
MLRLNRYDFEDPHELAKYAATCGMSLKAFEKRFRYLIDNDRLYSSNGNSEQLIKAQVTESNIVYEKKNPKKKEQAATDGKGLK